MNKLSISIFVVALVITSGCSTRGKGTYKSTTYSEPKSYSSNKDAHSASMDKKTYSHPTMRPYTIRGIKYYPTVVSVGDEFSGNASWYGPDFHGKLTSNGETYNMHDMTAAHKTLPMNTIVKVTNRRNGLTTVVRINDRGPFIATRIIDLSNKAAHAINMVGAGTAPVTLEILGFETKGKKTIPTKKEMKKAPQTKSIGNFALQIASFSKIEGALSTQEKYDQIDGYETMIQDVEAGGGRMFKVVLKGFKSEQEVRDYKENSQIFDKAFIIRLKED
ncbi:MAG: septal ring lytic transglycosylase RlpA family protein [Campylobacterota bacterium]|nr:septal ring lytic transglycosylase RlpA family protein [Campylobacterota bacterium]